MSAVPLVVLLCDDESDNHRDPSLAVSPVRPRLVALPLLALPIDPPTTVTVAAPLAPALAVPVTDDTRDLPLPSVLSAPADARLPVPWLQLTHTLLC